MMDGHHSDCYGVEVTVSSLFNNPLAVCRNIRPNRNQIAIHLDFASINLLTLICLQNAL